MRKKSEVVEVIDDSFEIPEWIKKMSLQEIEAEINRILREEEKTRGARREKQTK
mgnify:CR=1 FL=1